jgi:glutamate-ammonia-ligase adenylyltransferase
MGYSSLDSFDAALALHRSNARNWYLTLQEREEPQAANVSPQIAQWLDSMPASASFYESLHENESSLQRMLAIAERAPALVPQLQRSVTVTEQVMSGEVLEPAPQIIQRSDDLPRFAQSLRRAWLRTVARWVLTTEGDLSRDLADLYDQALAAIVKDLDIIALGSFGGRELVLYSDLDIVFWKQGPLDHEKDERNAQSVLAKVQTLRQHGAPIELDVRLRPEGKKGRLVHNEETLRHYAQSSMQPWERLALGRARPLPDAVKEAAFGMPLDLATLDQLAHVKKRVETERVPVQHRQRHIKLGPGGQDDVLWATQLLWWRHRPEPHVTGAKQRIMALQQARALNAIEADQLLAAWDLYLAARIHLGLLGLNDEVVPENPDKLARLAAALGSHDGNALLARFERHRGEVRALFEGTMERLRAQ